jgi:hypothetical protein
VSLRTATAVRTSSFTLAFCCCAATTAIFHLNKILDLNTRGECFDDKQGARTGIAGTYGETTIGLNVMPVSRINFRPELRGDFATQPSYGTVGSAHHKENQVSAGV